MRRNKKFRFQLMHAWLIANYKPCRVADVGGGKGLLSYLLQKDGWDSTVIDPVHQELPWKYKDIAKNKRMKILDRNSVKRITKEFQSEIVKDFDLIIGLHAHGSNMKIIDSCAKFKKSFMLLPCCVIDEPIEKKHGINWRESLIQYAEKVGFQVKKVKLNFKGKNIVIYSDDNLQKNDFKSDLTNILIRDE